MRKVEIRENELFIRKGFFPYHSERLIKEGDEIRFGDPVARTAVFDKITKMPWDSKNAVIGNPSVKIGDKVKKGDVIVEKVGIFSRPLNAPRDGRIISITGSAIYIEEGQKFETISSPFMGKVRSVSGDQYEVEMFGDAIQGSWGNETNAQGLLRLANEHQFSEPNTIIAVEGDLYEEDLIDLFESEHTGFVFAGVNAALTPRIIRSKKAVVLLCGFGATSFTKQIRKLLANNAGKPAIISGRIEDPLHGVFPELIFPRIKDDPARTTPQILKNKNAVLICSLTGQTRVGFITKSSQGRVKVSSGIHDHVVEVVFEDGSREIIPSSQIKKVI